MDDTIKNEAPSTASVVTIHGVTKTIEEHVIDGTVILTGTAGGKVQYKVPSAQSWNGE